MCLEEGFLSDEEIYKRRCQVLISCPFVENY